LKLTLILPLFLALTTFASPPAIDCRISVNEKKSIVSQNLVDPETFVLSKPIPVRAQDIHLQVLPKQAYQDQIFALTGEYLPQSVIDSSNLNYKFKFDNAPKLDLVVLSTLYARYDFTSHYFAQALKYHVDQGAMVVFAAAKSVIDFAKLTSPGKVPVTTQKDIDFMKYLSDMGVEVHVLGPNDVVPNRFNKIQGFLKAMHAKAFAVFSLSEPEKSQVFIGGRNKADPYYLENCPDLSQCAHMLQYKTESDWMNVADFDVSIKDHQFTRQVIEDFGLIFPDSTKQKLKKITEKPASTQVSRKVEDSKNVKITNFLSVSGKDLELLYVNTIDSANEKIRILTPYFNPTKEIAKALNRALKRNVSIEIVTNIYLHGDDFSPLIVSAIESFNQMGLSKLGKGVILRNWEAPSLFHSKVLQVDKDTMMVTSVNINNRSFKKDIENGVVIEGKEVSDQFNKEVFEKHILPHTQVIDGFNQPKLLYRLLYYFFGHHS